MTKQPITEYMFEIRDVKQPVCFQVEGTPADTLIMVARQLQTGNLVIDMENEGRLTFPADSILMIHASEITRFQ